MYALLPWPGSKVLPKPWKTGKGDPEAKRARPSEWMYACLNSLTRCHIIIKVIQIKM